MSKLTCNAEFYYVVMMSVLKLIVIVLNVTMISVTMLGNVSLRANMMIVFGLYVIILSVISLSDTMVMAFSCVLFWSMLWRQNVA